MAVLVTGASGVVGIHVARAFAAAGTPVVALSTRGRTPASGSLLDAFGDLVEFVAADVRDAVAIGDIAASRDIDGIVHAAGLTGEAQARARTADVIDVNVGGTATILEAARQAKLRRVVYFGTSAEYGRRADLAPIGEDEVNVEGMYAETKHLGHRLARRYAALFGLSTVTLRINSVYGPGTRSNTYRGMVGNTLVAHLTRAAAMGEAVRLPSGGDYPRGWTYVADVASGTALAFRALDLLHDTYNIASGRMYTVNEVVEAIRRVEPNADIDVGPGAFDDDPFQADNLRGPLDISRARTDLGFEPAWSLDAGLAAYIDWWRTAAPMDTPPEV